ncbi:MAG TPA: hypothetical protein VK995_05735 [Oceanipulchritudo sp.]|nr:hypothetical protein [Oceanipulchritudo sp.]
MKAGFKEKRGSSWRDIQQGNKGTKTTKVARKRHLVILFRGACVILLIMAIGAGVAGLKYFGKIAERIPEPPGPGVVQVTFQSNGVLTERWFRQSFPDLFTTDIRQVDVRLLKDQLEHDGQVSAATVNVSLPSHLIIQLEEREPIFRLRIQGPDGQPQTLLVGRDGTIYEGSLYPAETLLRLPGVSGLRVRKEGDGYMPIPGLEPVAHLLELAKEQLPAVYRHWRVVDLGDWNPDLEYRPSLVKITSSHIEEIVFSTVGIEEQIKRLAGILQHIQRHQLGQPKSIDLSFGEEAVIRYN